MLLAATQSWAEVRVSTPGVPAETVAVTGSQVAPLTAALALVVLAASAAILPTGGWLRRSVGAVMAAAGLVAAVVAATADAAVRSALAEAVASSPASLGGGAGTGGADVSWWRWLAVAAALLAAAVGAATARRGAAWAGMGRRYDSPSAPPGPAAQADPWRALDAGQDPTA